MKTEVGCINDADKVARFVAIFARHPIRTLIADAQAEVSELICRDHSYPITISDPTGSANCYLCHPTTAYIDYAIAEIRALNISRVSKWIMCALTTACRPLVRATGLDRQVQINNWMVSTNPAPTLTPDMAVALKSSCLAQFPGHAIVMRSLNEMWDVDTIAALRSAGFKMLAARQVYLLPQGATRPSRDAKRDAKLMEHSPLKVVEGDDLTLVDLERCAALYAALYLEKHTTLNPHYTAAFLRELRDANLMTIVALRDPHDGIVGFTGLFEHAGILTQPLVGYDTARPQNEGIYRMLMHIGRDYAGTCNLDYNMSAGAPAFKRNRGAIAAIEYTAVYVAHLSWKNRVATGILEFVSTKLGVAAVKRFEG